MIVDLDAETVAEHRLAEWSTAEILDTPLDDASLLRALVCRLETGRWQWSISSLDAHRTELISTGVESNAAAARTMARSEIAKCLESALD